MNIHKICVPQSSQSSVTEALWPTRRWSREATTRGVRKASERNVRTTASSWRSRRQRTGSAKPVDRRSNMGHTKHWRLQALRGRWCRQQLVTFVSDLHWARLGASSSTWTKNCSSALHIQHNQLSDRWHRYRTVTHMHWTIARSTNRIN